MQKHFWCKIWPCEGPSSNSCIFWLISNSRIGSACLRTFSKYLREAHKMWVYKCKPKTKQHSSQWKCFNLKSLLIVFLTTMECTHGQAGNQYFYTDVLWNSAPVIRFSILIMLLLTLSSLYRNLWLETEWLLYPIPCTPLIKLSVTVLSFQKPI